MRECARCQEKGENVLEEATESKEKILVGKRGAAQRLDVSVRTIDNLVRSKKLMPRRIGMRVLFLVSDLQKFAQRAK